MRPYRLIGRTTRNNIAEHFLQAVISWQKAWCIDVHQSEIDFSVDNSDGSLKHGIGSKYNDEYSLFCIEDQIDWAGLIFGHKAVEFPEDAITKAVVADAKNGLFAQILKDFNLESKLEAGKISLNSSLRNGDVIVSVRLGNQNLLFWLSKIITEKFISFNSKVKNLELTKRSEACMSAKTSVAVTLNLGSFPIESIKSLSVGDILSTDTKLNTPLSLMINEKKSLPVNLGRVENQKAVAFLSNIK